MKCMERLETYLRENGVAFEVQHHPRAYTAQDVAASEHLSNRLMAKVVMVVADGELLMLVVPTAERVHVPHSAEALGAKEVRLADEGEFAGTFADCEVGAMPPFGNLYGVPVWVDESLTKDQMIYFQAGTHTETMSIAYDDYERLVKPQVGSFSQEKLLHYNW